jgi:CheY-like chemotaxis protein
LLGGDLAVSSRVGVGTTFTCELVVDPGDETELAKFEVRTRVVRLAPGQKRPRILIVDDEENNRALLNELLSRLDIDVVEATDGASAVELYGRQKPDLVLMDVKMPVMDGVEATGRIRRNEDGARVPIILLSASVLGEDQRNVLGTGGSEFIPKPFMEDAIWDALERHLGLAFVRSSPVPAAEREPSLPTRDDVDALGPETVQALREAAELGYVGRIPGILSSVSREKQHTARAITKLAQNLELDSLLRLLEKPL